jgi:LuxR family maltose regulon positive regulatory protein
VDFDYNSIPEHLSLVAFTGFVLVFMSNSLKLSGTDEFLSTKFAVPHLRASIVPRAQLTARLNDGLQAKLTLVSAPAGFGKTTLVANWISDLSMKSADFQVQRGKNSIQNQQSATSNRMIAWVSLDPDDNDPVRFWRYVLTASRAFDAEISQSALDLLNYSPQPPFEDLLTGFINQAARLESRAVLVLDDYHVITAPPIHETLAFFLEHLPPTLHVILVTRSDPPLPLARLRARNELYELLAEDLRFSLAETQAFIEHAIPSTLTPDIVTRLAERTEGWAAGLHLVMLALQRLEDPVEIQQFLETFTGSLRPSRIPDRGGIRSTIRGPPGVFAADKLSKPPDWFPLRCGYRSGRQCDPARPTGTRQPVPGAFRRHRPLVPLSCPVFRGLAELRPATPRGSLST